MEDIKNNKNITESIILPSKSLNILYGTESLPYITPSSTWSTLNDIELLLNKKRYNKYLEKNNPIKLKEMKELYRDKTLYYERIMSSCNSYLENNTFQLSNDLDELFEKFSVKLISHFKLKDYEKSTESNSYEDDSDDNDNMLFGTISDNVNTNKIDKFSTGIYRLSKNTNLQNDNEMNQTDISINTSQGLYNKSYWGKQIYKK